MSEVQIQSVVLGTTAIGIDNLIPNDWNANVMPSDDLERMAERFRERQTIDKPLTVRPLGNEGTFQIIDGEQSYQAAKMAGFIDVPCIIEDMDDVTAIATTFVKNLHGEMNSLLVGRSIVRMKDIAKASGSKITNADIGKLMNKTETTIRNYEIYAKCSEMISKKEDRSNWYDDSQLAAATTEEIKKIYDELRRGGPASEDLPELAGAAEEKPKPTEQEKAAKLYDKTLVSLQKMTPSQRLLLRNELNSLIRKDKELGHAE